jgi:hypothetical protein
MAIQSPRQERLPRGGFSRIVNVEWREILKYEGDGGLEGGEGQTDVDGSDRRRGKRGKSNLVGTLFGQYQ